MLVSMNLREQDVEINGRLFRMREADANRSRRIESLGNAIDRQNRALLQFADDGGDLVSDAARELTAAVDRSVALLMAEILGKPTDGSTELESSWYGNLSPRQIQLISQKQKELNDFSEVKKSSNDTQEAAV